MATRKAASDGRFAVSIILSTVIHVVVFLLLIWSGRIFPTSMPVQETYYVDVINLPVASPRAGSPTQKGNGVEAPSPPSPKKSMTLPAPQKTAARPKQQTAQKLPQKPIQKTAQKAAKKTAQKPVEKATKAAESDAFADKMAKLQGKAEAQHEEAAVEHLRRKGGATGSGRSGMPGGSGTEAGSRYEDYIKSRLEDALKKTSSYSTKKPVVSVRLTIAVDGQIIGQKIVKTSGDHAFELAVLRAIEIVGETLQPPPNQRIFEGVIKVTPR